MPILRVGNEGPRPIDHACEQHDFTLLRIEALYTPTELQNLTLVNHADAEGFFPRFRVSIPWAYSASAEGDKISVFESDGDSFIARRGWSVQVVGGIPGREYQIYHDSVPENTVIRNRYALTRYLQNGRLIVTNYDIDGKRSAFTHYCVLRGPVIDSSGIQVPLNVDLPLTYGVVAGDPAVFQMIVKL